MTYPVMVFVLIFAAAMAGAFAGAVVCVLSGAAFEWMMDRMENWWEKR